MINVIEGTGLLLRCAHKTIETWTPTWLKEGEPDFRVVSDTLHIDSFRVKHQGTYTCAFAPSEGEFTRNSVEINCLCKHFLFLHNIEVYFCQFHKIQVRQSSQINILIFVSVICFIFHVGQMR